MHLPFMRRYSWEQIITEVLSQPKHTDIEVEKWRVPPIPSDFTERQADDFHENRPAFVSMGFLQRVKR